MLKFEFSLTALHPVKEIIFSVASHLALKKDTIFPFNKKKKKVRNIVCVYSGFHNEFQAVYSMIDWEYVIPLHLFLLS